TAATGSVRSSLGQPGPTWRRLPGPRRRDHSHLPAVIEEQEIPGSSVAAGAAAAPSRPSAAPRTPLSWLGRGGLLDKYLFCRPPYRLLADVRCARVCCLIACGTENGSRRDCLPAWGWARAVPRVERAVSVQNCCAKRSHPPAGIAQNHQEYGSAG